MTDNWGLCIRCDPIPTAIRGAPRPYAQAIISLLDPNAFAVEDPSDPIDFEAARECAAIVMIQGDDSWDHLRDLTKQPNITVVAIIPDLRVRQFARALAMGCDGVVQQDTSAEIIVSVLEAALIGEVVLPKEAAAELAGSLIGVERVAEEFTEDERHLLYELANGSTIVKLADEMGWSERTIRRRFQSVAIKLHVQNRAQAIIKASQLGLIE